MLWEGLWGKVNKNVKANWKKHQNFKKKINNLREEIEEKKNIRLVQFVAGVTLYSFFSGGDAQWNGHHN